MSIEVAVAMAGAALVAGRRGSVSLRAGIDGARHGFSASSRGRNARLQVNRRRALFMHKEASKTRLVAERPCICMAGLR
jgi:hypothetical protein